MSLDLSINQIASDYSLGVSVDDHQVEHLSPRIHFDRPVMNLTAQCLIGAQQYLLSRLTARVTPSVTLRPTEAPITEQPAICPTERNTLCHALVNYVHTDFGQAINIGFARAKVTTLDRVIKKPVNTISVIAIIFRGIDPPLGGDRVCTT